MLPPSLVLGAGYYEFESIRVSRILVWTLEIEMKIAWAVVYKIVLIVILLITAAGLNCQDAQAQGLYALNFASSSNNYVGSSSGSSFGLSVFTLELWLYRKGVGTSATSGNGGITDGIPLITKGRGEADGSNLDCNYFLSIHKTDGTLGADFEDMATGLNHPISGITPILNNVWYHVAATYDGTTWTLYLNGQVEKSLYVGTLNSARATPRYDSIQWFGIGTTFDSLGRPGAYFDGVLDEIRIWNYARTPDQIRANMNADIQQAYPGLAGCWGLNEGTGTTTGDSSGNGNNLAVVGATWVPQGSRPVNVPPNQPVLNSPGDGTSLTQTNVTLNVTVSDPDSNNLSVSFWGRALTPLDDFTIVALPDTQYYSKSYPQVFLDQTQWIVDNKESRNIVFVSHMGDITDNNSIPSQWLNANNAMSLLDGQVPYAISVGNHDQTWPIPGDTANFNATFPYTRYEGLPWYGGHYGDNNDNSYQLFSAGGLEWIILHLKDHPTGSVLAWADSIIKSYPNRRAIVTSHDMLTKDIIFDSAGTAIYDTLKGNTNLFLLLCGHVTAGRRSDTYNGNVINTLMADYQQDTVDAQGGNGWLRIMEFEPDDNRISVFTYSPLLNQFDTSSNSQFVVPYNMYPSVLFQNLGSVNGVLSGNTVSLKWPTGLVENTEYEWYVTVTDGNSTVTGSTWSFKSVFNRTINSIAVTPANSSISVGQIRTFSAAATYSDLTTADITANATWNSSDTGIASMTGNAAKGVSQGQTNITATQGGITSNVAVLTVTPATMTSITVSPASASISVGQSRTFSATATYSDLTTSDITATATWSSSATSIAIVTGNVAKGVSQGQTNVTATQSGVTSNVAVLTVTSQKADTRMSVSAASGVYGSVITLSAKLTKTTDGSAISGKIIVFTGNGFTIGTGTTDTMGLATLKNVSLIGINAGVYSSAIGASFAGDSDFTASSGKAQLTVTKATPTITWNNPANITYGTPLSSTQLNAVASVKGTFKYTPSAGTVFPVGNGQSLRVDFTPTNTVNYQTASKTVSINVLATTTTSLTITSPASGSVLTVGSTITISWISTGDPGYLNLVLSRDGGVTWAPIKYYTPNDGKETWTVSGPATSNARIGLFCVNNSKIYSITKVTIK
jgi:uncharacterized protein YjdB